MDDVITIRLSKDDASIVATIDAADERLVTPYRWYANRSPSGCYAVTWQKLPGEPRTRIPMHRLILPVADGMVVDHLDGNGLNNRRGNLRPATHQQNGWNRRKQDGPTTSLYKGVTYLFKANLWRAGIAFDGTHYNLGCYESEQAAALVYDVAARRCFGKFAKTNFDEGDELHDELARYIYKHRMRD